eukprot:6974594-Pyramimonas_sp.AAC.1
MFAFRRDNLVDPDKHLALPHQVGDARKAERHSIQTLKEIPPAVHPTAPAASPGAPERSQSPSSTSSSAGNLDHAGDGPSRPDSQEGAKGALPPPGEEASTNRSLESSPENSSPWDLDGEEASANRGGAGASPAANHGGGIAVAADPSADPKASEGAEGAAGKATNQSAANPSAANQSQSGSDPRGEADAGAGARA